MTVKKSAVLYLILAVVLLFRLNNVCEGDFQACQAGVETYSYYESPESTSAGMKKLDKFRLKMIKLARKHLPSPHSELVLGMTVGVDRLYEVPKFKKMLRDTGTIHVVVVSGYNITLVYNAIIKMVGSPYKSRNVALGLLGTLLFAVVSGFEPPVVRAWVMGSMISLSKYYGRKIPAMKVLLVTGLILAVINPKYIYSLSFQLSFLATLSLIMFESGISSKLGKLFKSKNVFIDDLSATISAQVLIWPYLSYKFGQVSLLSPLINGLVLWTVPLATVIGSVFLALGSLSAILGSFLAVFVYLPADFFVVVVEFFYRFEKFVVTWQASLTFLLVYYSVAFIIYFKNRRSE